MTTSSHRDADGRHERIVAAAQDRRGNEVRIRARN
jgi:hypothetical protein